jgi:hypothetical protein
VCLGIRAETLSEVYRNSFEMDDPRTADNLLCSLHNTYRGEASKGWSGIEFITNITIQKVSLSTNAGRCEEHMRSVFSKLEKASKLMELHLHFTKTFETQHQCTDICARWLVKVARPYLIKKEQHQKQETMPWQQIIKFWGWSKGEKREMDMAKVAHCVKHILRCIESG